MRTGFSFFITLSLLLGSVGSAFAQRPLSPIAWDDIETQNVKATTRQNEPTVSGTVSKIDHDKRLVDLQTPLGPFRIKVSSARAQNLKEGDTLTVQLAQLERKNPLAELL